MNQPILLTPKSDLQHMRQASHTEELLDKALDECQALLDANDRLTAALKDAIGKNQPLRASRDWWRMAWGIFAFVAVVEAVALYWTH